MSSPWRRSMGCRFELALSGTKSQPIRLRTPEWRKSRIFLFLFCNSTSHSKSSFVNNFNKIVCCILNYIHFRLIYFTWNSISNLFLPELLEINAKRIVKISFQIVCWILKPDKYLGIISSERQNIAVSKKNDPRFKYLIL